MVRHTTVARENSRRKLLLEFECGGELFAVAIDAPRYVEGCEDELIRGTAPSRLLDLVPDNGHGDGRSGPGRGRSFSATVDLPGSFWLQSTNTF